MLTLPSGPSSETTRLVVAGPLVKLRLEATGRGVADGQTVKKLSGPVARSTVMFSTTARAPLSGTPPAPATWSWMSVPGGTAPAAPPVPVPVRVSRTRAGLTGTNEDPTASTALAYHPCTSATTSTVPLSLKIDTLPPSPTLATTRLGTDTRAVKLRLEAPGRVVPLGQTVRKPWGPL